MKLYYWREQKNFGDALNEWLWPRFLNGILDDDDRALFVGIGTLLREEIPEQPFKAVFGTGAGYGKQPCIDDKWKIYGVRGPLTAKMLGLPSSAAITDAAALIRLVDIPAEPKQYRAAFMPHWESMAYWDWSAVCAASGIHFIDPMGATEDVIRSIQRSEVVIAEAMHGAIVADALRVPWIPVLCYEQILSFKWADWCGSLGLSYDPIRLPPLYNRETLRSKLPKRLSSVLHMDGLGNSRLLARLLGIIGAGAGELSGPVYGRRAARLARTLKSIADGRAPTLSSDRVIESVTARLEEQLARFRTDYYAGALVAPGA